MNSNEAINKTAVEATTTNSESSWSNADLMNFQIVETETNLLSQFRANLDQVEQLNARLHFVLNEIRPLMR